MKKLFLIMGCAILVALSASCARDCKCTYFEDGKKVAIESSAKQGYKVFDKADCELGSEAEHTTTVCKVNCAYEAGPEPDYSNYEAWLAWQEKVAACRKLNEKEVKAKTECK